MVQDAEGSELLLSRYRLPSTPSVWSILIAVGLACHLVFPFVHNPMDFLASDCLRHYQGGMNPQANWPITIGDCIGYQYWLHAIFATLGDSKLVVASSAAILSVAAPITWYLWLKEFLSPRLSLIGFAVLSLMPSWIRIYGFLMQETLLIPACGAALWMSFAARKKPSLASYSVAGFLWGLAVATKISVLPIAVMVISWLGWQSWRSKQARAYWAILILIAAVFPSIGILRVYCQTGTISLLPPIMAPNKAYFESGAKKLITHYHWQPKGEKQAVFPYTCVSPSVAYPPLQPLSSWTTARTGSCTLDYDFNKGELQPAFAISLEDRLRYTVEGAIYFFAGYSWPDDDPDRPSLIENGLNSCRFIWLPITLLTILLAIKRRQNNVVICTFVVLTLAYLCQQNGIMEGRYRKVWEGLAIASLLCLFNQKAESSSDPALVIS